MNFDMIREKFHRRVSKPLDVKDNYAVLVPLIKKDGKIELLYEIRAENLKNQPGEISFPGGKVEIGENFKEAAARETCEELNICKENIEVIGHLDYLVSYSNISIYPFLGILHDTNFEDIKYSEDEVSSIFTVPFKFFMENEPKVYYIDLETSIGEKFPYEKIPGGKNYDWKQGKYSVYFYEYKKYTIWGMTAKITKNFIDIIKS
ncbi:NUDIX hydrolase [Sporanaerobacter acetigenes]|uniref:NUDIX domain-containing protein n=1 Tax=Sporanaerobacter acetigenes DSM 13106 TaxID=1123281 RepID=A0A1M5Y4U9_9FIRM|nr:CoA pyrophosphatase [Sporanaerobacter acetigenes]SHI06959.1 NUDIX domain-containing protein [Sporanaerobacter acetigenes DSM 13106]